MSIRVMSIRPISNHHLVKAVVELEVGGLRLRGLKLEQAQQQWKLSPPGRKIQGRWQVLYDFVDCQAYRDLLKEVLTHDTFPPSLVTTPFPVCSARPTSQRDWDFEESCYE